MFRLSLRKKLLLVSMLIFLVPWVGIRYIQAIENYLQQSLLDNLSHYTQSVATGLAQRAELIPEFPSGEAAFALPLAKPPQLDGYDDDWEDYDAYRQQLRQDNRHQSLQDTPTLLTGLYGNNIYLYISVPDQQIIYRQQDAVFDKEKSASVDQAVDMVRLRLDSGEIIRELFIQTEAPGSIKARDAVTTDWESRIKGIWRETDDGTGYQIELSIPHSYMARGFNVQVSNTDTDSRAGYALSESRTIPLLSSPQQLTQQFSEFSMVPGRRLWLLDNEGRVLVKSGNLLMEGELTPVNPLFAWLLTPQLIADPWKGKTRLERDDIQVALTGKADSRRLAGENGENIILSSAWPVKEGEQTIAVLLIEESTAAIQIMQRTALSELLNLSLVVFLLLSFALIGFAGRLSLRIRRLRDITDNAIDKHGRVTGRIPENRKGDELDELASHVNDMLHRLRNYHDYLEKLASRLSHELRTPIAVVRSSLENLHLEQTSPETHTLLNRAENGIMRLQTILNRMSEASRLEQSIDDCEWECFDLSAFLQDMLSGYRDIYSGQPFELNVAPGTVTASKDLLAQGLDKLVNNAVDFASPSTAIVISGDIQQEFWQLAVANEGQPLPDTMEQQLFQSMVSIRDSNTKNDEPHLGLGLYIVRLIAEFHGGEVRAKNQPGGVCFTMTFPRRNRT